MKYVIFSEKPHIFYKKNINFARDKRQNTQHYINLNSLQQ